MSDGVKLTTDERRVAIADQIVACAGQRPSVQQLADTFEVSTETIYRDLRHPYVRQKIQENVMALFESIDLADARETIMAAIHHDCSVTARWLVDRMTVVEDKQKEDIEEKLTRKILGQKKESNEEDN